MTQLKNKPAYDKLIRARTRLLVSNQFFAVLAMHLGAVEQADAEWWKAAGGTDKPTMAVDGYTMYYHPDFVLSLEDKELEGVIAHEVMHCAFKHMSRRGLRHPVMWNWAGDYVINDALLQAGLTLPKERLHDKKYEGMSTEEVYERIKQDMMQQKKNADGENKDKGGCGVVLDAGKPGNADKDAANANAEREWETTLRVAVAVAKAANAGNMPAYLERLVGELKAPRVSWRQLLRQFIDGNMHKDYSYSRPNRRNSMMYPAILPGLVPDALHKLVCFMDVSGSVSDELMAAMGSEVAGALDDGVADTLILAYIDTEIKKVDEYLPGDLVEAKCAAGGGTDFRPAFTWVKEHHPDASCIIYLTDMMPNTWELPPCDLPVMWAAWCPEHMLKSIPLPYGQVVHIDGWE